PGESFEGAAEVASDMDAFYFYGCAGDQVIITAVTVSGALNTDINLYPPAGGAKEADSNGGDELAHVLQQTGLYTVVIWDYASLIDIGEYVGALVKIPGDPCPGVYNPRPAEAATVCAGGGALSWDAVPGATYDVWFGQDTTEPLALIAEDIAAPSLPMPPLEPDTVYYWHVVAHTPEGDIGGPYWWFLSLEPIIADFSANPRWGAAPVEVHFTDLSSGDPTCWDWDFGDGQGSTEQSLTHEYQAPGSYTVSL
ncbi:MAG: PKD domain-containing protein, partial [Gemmatimonadales bacterium]|nr:PKD domain-containing protein [Gemmatimonadales bacterium]